MRGEDLIFKKNLQLAICPASPCIGISILAPKPAKDKISWFHRVGQGRSYETKAGFVGFAHLYFQGRSQPPQVGGAKLKRKKIWGAKIRKNNKFWGKILIFLKFFLIFFNFLGENLGAWGGPGPPKPQGGSAPVYFQPLPIYALASSPNSLID
jgi:hypothetical protein